MEEKTIIFLRHAKSSWSDFTAPDFDRVLNKRGQRDAPFMAEVCAQNFATGLDLIITSPAKRALTTAHFFKEAFSLSKEVFWEDKRLYHAYSDTIQEVIQECPNEYQHILIAGHNPGLTNFVNEFDSFSLDNLPTCGIVVVKMKIKSWSDFCFDQGQVTSFHYPKQYFK